MTDVAYTCPVRCVRMTVLLLLACLLFVSTNTVFLSTLLPFDFDDSSLRYQEDDRRHGNLTGKRM